MLRHVDKFTAPLILSFYLNFFSLWFFSRFSVYLYIFDVTLIHFGGICVCVCRQQFIRFVMIIWLVSFRDKHKKKCFIIRLFYLIFCCRLSLFLFTFFLFVRNTQLQILCDRWFSARWPYCVHRAPIATPDQK